MGSHQPSSIRNLRDAIVNRQLFIADGHHRYTAALNYRDELRRAGLDYPQADWTLAYITYVDDRRAVLPIHRVIRSLGHDRWGDLRRKLTRYYDTKSVKLSTG